MLPKIRITSRKASNKSCSELNYKYNFERTENGRKITKNGALKHTIICKPLYFACPMDEQSATLITVITFCSWKISIILYLAVFIYICGLQSLFCLMDYVQYEILWFFTWMLTLAQNVKSKKKGAKCEKSDAKYPDINRLQTIYEKSARCKKLARKKGAHMTTQKFTHVSQFNYYLLQLNFIPYRMRKSLCLVHNYRFYHKPGWDVKHEKSVSWSRINNTK